MSFVLLGILNSQAAGVEAGAYDLLETTTLASSASSVTFSGLGSYTDYKHLQIRYVGRHSGSTGNSLQMILNADSGSSYRSHVLLGDGSSVVSTQTSSLTFFMSNDSGGSTNVFASGVIDFLDAFDNSKNTTLRTLSGVTDPNTYSQVRLTSGGYFNTAAMTSIEISGNSGDLVTGSRFSLYGIKAA